MVDMYKDDNGNVAEIILSDTAVNPRDENINSATFVCFHARYTLGDDHSMREEDYDGWDDMRKALFEEEGAVAILPMYIYDHGGITISTSPFGCKWDSGQVGWAYMSENTIREECDTEEVSEENIEWALAKIEEEIDIYDKYVSGDVYNIEVKDTEGNIVDVFGGFFGSQAAEEAIEIEFPEMYRC